MSILTLDIGGTTIKSSLYREDGTQQIEFEQQPTAISQHHNQIAQQVIDWCLSIKQHHTVDGIAISTAGGVDPYHGHILFAGPTIPDYTGTPLKARIEQACQLPCHIENDVNAMALGEAWLGAARDCQSALCLTLGTGVGGAVLLNGKLWHGHGFAAGEIGYTPLADGRRLDEAASTTALLTDYEKYHGERIDGKTLFKRLAQKDDHAKDALARMLDALSSGLLPSIYLLAPDAIIIGGGIAAQHHLIEPQLTQRLTEQLYNSRFMPPIIRCAALGNHAGRIGALRWFLDRSCHQANP